MKRKTGTPYKETLIEELKKPKAAVAYLSGLLEQGDHKSLMLGIKDVAMARGGVAKMAESTGISRTYLYDLLAGRVDLRLTTFTKLLKAVGGKLILKPASKQKSTAA